MLGIKLQLLSKHAAFPAATPTALSSVWIGNNIFFLQKSPPPSFPFECWPLPSGRWLLSFILTLSWQTFQRSHKDWQGHGESKKSLLVCAPLAGKTKLKVEAYFLLLTFWKKWQMADFFSFSPLHVDSQDWPPIKQELKAILLSSMCSYHTQGSHFLPKPTEFGNVGGRQTDLCWTLLIFWDNGKDEPLHWSAIPSSLVTSTTWEERAWSESTHSMVFKLRVIFCTKQQARNFDGGTQHKNTWANNRYLYVLDTKKNPNS